MAAYAEFVIRDNAILFETVCDARKDAYRKASCVMAMNGCFDDAAFLMSLIGEHGACPWMIEIAGPNVDSKGRT